MERERAKPGSANRGYGLWAILLSLLFVYSFALAGAAGQKSIGATKAESTGGVFGANKKEPIFITSDRMEVDQKKQTITYTGRIVAQQGDLIMKSQVLTANYDADMKALNEVVAEGQVQVTQGNRVATGTKAVFNDKNQTIILTGDPVVRQGNNQVSGSRITFFVEQERAVVEGGSQRVKATIFPEEIQKREKEQASPSKGQ